MILHTTSKHVFEWVCTYFPIIKLIPHVVLSGSVRGQNHIGARSLLCLTIRSASDLKVNPRLAPQLMVLHTVCKYVFYEWCTCFQIIQQIACDPIRISKKICTDDPTRFQPWYAYVLFLTSLYQWWTTYNSHRWKFSHTLFYL